jgi:riboflavin synthase
MFTGIIQALGRVASIQTVGEDCQFHLDVGDLPMTNTDLGDSIAVNGVCLTVIKKNAHSFWADVSLESLRVTTLGELGVGEAVNLEKALTLATPLGGHLVSGHVDGVGRVVSIRAEGRSLCYRIEVPSEIQHYIAAKGSVCIDGISLTVNRVEGAVFSVNVVPHTLSKTTLSACREGRLVNIEVDVLARYLERLMGRDTETSSEVESTQISFEFLKKNGF